MKFRRTIRKTFGSPKVKSIQMHPTRPLGIVGLFSGDVQVWDTDKMEMVNSIRVSGEPIRTCVILWKMDWLLVGSDDGNVSIYELGKFRKIRSFHAHDDFIRKIEGHPQDPSFLTASDDTTLKMWVYEGDVGQTMTYSGHSHFVMDVCFYPNDASKFVSCSLDSTIKVWSVGQGHCVKTFKGHTSGINSICFLRGDCLVSGADDLTLRAWDFQTAQCIAVLGGHTNNVNRVYPLASFPLFASCGEDGSMRLWNSKTFKQEDMIALQGGRVWDVKEKGGKLMVGSDEELVFIDAQQASSLVRMSRNRIFYSVSDSVFGVKSDSIGVSKELCSLGFYPDELEVSPSGKTIAVGSDGEFKVFSSLGFRSKFGGDGRDLHFIDDDEFVARSGDVISFYRKASVERSIRIAGASRMFVLSSWLMGCSVGDETRIYSLSGQLLASIEHVCDHLVLVGGFLVACGGTMRIYRVEQDVIDGFIEQEIEVPEEGIEGALVHVGTEHHVVSSWCVRDDVLYFASGGKGYYLIMGDRPYVYHFSSVEGTIAGVDGDLLFYLHEKAIESKKIDGEFLEFQRAVIAGRECRAGDGIRSKAIVFFESLGMHERALELCVDDNQRFEILLKLDRYDEAFSKANSIVKYDKLGKYFLKAGELGKASECFFRSRNWVSLLLADVLSGKTRLAAVGALCRKEGRLNHAFFAYLKSGMYAECGCLLEGTPFLPLFSRNHLD